VKLLNKTGEKFVFELMSEEKELLSKIFGLYPMLDRDKLELSKTIKDEQICQSKKILSDAFKEFQDSNKRFISELFEKSNNFKPSEDYEYYTLELDGEQIERLLQILNDIRVGMWQKLGCPDLENRKDFIRSAEDVFAVYIMDICEYFEYYLLKALGY
jgi:hypothetical protein